MRFWFNNGFWEEGLKWSRSFLASPESLAHTPHLVRAFSDASFIARANAELVEAQVWAQASLALGQDINDQGGIARAHSTISRISHFGSKKSRDHLHHSLKIARSLQEGQLIAYDLNLLGMIELYEGNVEMARTYFVESLEIARKGKFRTEVAWPSSNLGVLAFQDGNFDSAQRHWSSALMLFHEQGSKDGQAAMLSGLAALALRQDRQSWALSYLNQAKEICLHINQNYWRGSLYSLVEALYLIRTNQEHDRVIQICSECYQQARNADNKDKKCEVLSVLVEWAMAVDQVVLGVRLVGAMEGGDPCFGKPMYPLYRMDIERNISLAQQKLDESTITSLMAEGQAMTVDEAITIALVI